MNQIFANSTAFGFVLTLIAYGIGVYLKKKLHYQIFNPILIAIVVIIGFLSFFNVDYENYNSSAQYISYFLTPATVSLAIPLYRQISLLKRNLKAIIVGILSGVLSSMVSVWGFSKLFGFTHIEYVTLLPKSVTTAIGMGISEELGGLVSITVATIIITGIIGNVFSNILFKCFNIVEPIAKGLSLGTASHAIGTSKAMELGEIEGAMSSLSIVVSGLLTVIIAPLFSNLI
ncbi:LrgB family protein [Lutispora thermophila]|uniref:TIGR00659 family protein n=1 Tax=Lutispora thermophila DSM 19022 TaxID=1122184 RepID=A0A1M6ID34_9FIRM|nr:LrgB family protein [Lutispora thermophila]SHJ32382.1 TIGR00659 family protein [Lutispora thermophila DSM 19022]